MSHTHLTDEQLDGLLAEKTADEQTMMHLKACADCRGELESMRAAVGDLRELSMQWAEERAVRVQVPSLWTRRWHAVPGWGAAVAALLLCGIAIGVHEQGAGRSAAVPRDAMSQISRMQRPVEPSADVLAQDNRLLRSIDDELSRQVRPQVPAAELGASSRAVRRRMPREVAN